ncbi:hypothetical protein XELAEV_18023098mg [Xenopus laevis]|uniref:Uncharacterized protein n=1 Tax=Xenopus laevis TaxID=8355 RepID=A0A974D4G7_XENLA|nr:hypothetical protein XELAEV_18023098mg [Xenopus laevis]
MGAAILGANAGREGRAARSSWTCSGRRHRQSCWGRVSGGRTAGHIYGIYAGREGRAARSSWTCSGRRHRQSCWGRVTGGRTAGHIYGIYAGREGRAAPRVDTVNRPAALSQGPWRPLLKGPKA